MTKELLSYLQACKCDFEKFVNTELENQVEGETQPSQAYYAFLNELKTTPFYTGKWPDIDDGWWSSRAPKQIHVDIS